MIAREIIQVDGLAVELRRQSQKTIRLHVEPTGLVWLSLPPRCSTSRILSLVRAQRRWIDERLAAFEEQRSKPTLWGQPLPDAVPGPALDRLLRAEAERATAELAARWEPAVGVSVAAWRFRWMRSRWGSCQTRTAKITINVALAALPVECLEEVVVHELVHLHVPGHGAEFRALMDLNLPTWRMVRHSMRDAVPARPSVAAGPPTTTRPAT
jgi:predicted metal-dependent hydrolase